MREHNIIVMGASYGGIEAYLKLVSLLPEKFPASIFIVQHIPADAVGYLHKMLSRNGPLRAVQAKDGKEFEPGMIYVARPNHHLLVKERHIATPMGPRENRMRPSIDVLFRSAAVFHNSRVAALLLSGFLDDGVSGLEAVQRCGGITLVQDRAEAAAPELVRNAIRRVKVDHVLPLEELALELVKIAGTPAGEEQNIPEEIVEEMRVSEYPVQDIERFDRLGERTILTCPECGGPIWNLKNEPIPRYVCHTGHSFTPRAFLEGQSKMIEYSLWSAIRLMDERAKVLENITERDRERGRTKSAAYYEKTVPELKMHSRIIRDFILSGALASAMGEDGNDTGSGS